MVIGAKGNMKTYLYRWDYEGLATFEFHPSDMLISYRGKQSGDTFPVFEQDTPDILDCQGCNLFHLSWLDGIIELKSRSSSGRTYVTYRDAAEYKRINTIALASGVGSESEWQIVKKSSEIL